MGRRAVAATIASVVVFTTMLLANAALYSAENSYQGAAVLSSAQQNERGYASVLLGVSAFSSLAHTESFLRANPMDCSSPNQYLASVSGVVNNAGQQNGISYSAESSWSYVSSPGPSQTDRLLPSQFDGYTAGDLDLRVVTALNESFAGGLPSYSASFVETVHLPVQVQRTASDCVSALGELRAALSSAPCNSSGVTKALSLASFRAPLLASFQYGASTSGPAGHCILSYWVRTTQSGIPGVSGTFQWTAFGSGSLSPSAPLVLAPSAP